jgi:hypothetical protein
MDNKKSVVNLLKEWVELTELKIGTYQKYKDAAVKSANFHTDQGDFKAHQADDDSAGEEHFSKSSKRHAGIKKANKMIHRKKRKGENDTVQNNASLKPVQVKSEPSLAQRIKRSMGI